MAITTEDIAVVERDGLLDALEKAEKEREHLRTIARHRSEQLLAAGEALADAHGGTHYRACAAESLHDIQATNPARWARNRSAVAGQEG